MNNELDNECKEKLERFLILFELVFNNDWGFTQIMLEDRNEFYIRSDATFLEPGVEDEHNNWSNRGALLKAYRDLVLALVATYNVKHPRSVSAQEVRLSLQDEEVTE